MTTAIITGATSFIGLAVAKELLRQGFSVYAVVREGSKGAAMLPDGRNFHIIWKDMACLSELPNEIEHADVFIHLAWDGVGSAGRSDVKIQEDNIRYSMAAVEAAAALGCSRFLFSGSQAEYGIHQEAMSEESNCLPVSEYGKAKLKFGALAEIRCGELGMEYIHTRIFSVYGPGDHPWSLVNTCIGRFLSGERMELGECTQLWNFLYIDDCARAMVSLLKADWLKAVGGCVYNIAAEDTRVLREFVEKIHELCGSRGSYHYGDRPPNAEGPANLIPDIGKIVAVTGWRPEVSFEEGIKKTIGFYKIEGDIL